MKVDTSSILSSISDAIPTAWQNLINTGQSILSSSFDHDGNDASTPRRRGNSSSLRPSSSTLLQRHQSDTNMSQGDLGWMIRHDENPYNAVRGHGFLPSSMTAIRSLLNVVQNNHDISESETASQLAEGTIRAWRDLALDEAVELQTALRYWNSRWERPLLSWLEQGTYEYNHQNIGKTVGQLQAVLARRCANIGELQERLLQAGWREGVAQWGVLGGGHSWAAVAGFDPTPRMPCRRNSGSETENIGMMDSARQDDGVFRKASQAQIFVGRHDGDGIYVDDPSFLAEWSVDSIRLIRRQLLRAGNHQVELPWASHWVDTDGNELRIPTWATEPTELRATPEYAPSPILTGRTTNVTISDLPAMVKEVEDLLDSMHTFIAMQRSRRLDQMRPPPWIRRNWYIVATVLPTSLWLGFRLFRGGTLQSSIRHFFSRVAMFFQERVSVPLSAIVNELWQGRESFSDQKARDVAMDSLKNMIRSWLDETYPTMPEAKRIEMAEAMDISLLEKKKEESMKTFYEINNVVRMSFIEMQYMKKEMMNALHAMDEVMSSNDINMNLAAITPVALLGYVSVRVSRFFYYACLKIGRSREETYAVIRNIVTDIERLLVMRNNPPLKNSREVGAWSSRQCVINSDDLGMLMLLIHELRSILIRDRRRFTENVIRNVWEDLAELSGERGAVSIEQQLSIVNRMCRTYPFLKVVSTGHLFEFNPHWQP